MLILMWEATFADVVGAGLTIPLDRKIPRIHEQLDTDDDLIVWIISGSRMFWYGMQAIIIAD